MSAVFDGSTVLEHTGSLGLTDAYTHVCWFKPTTNGTHRSPLQLKTTSADYPRSYLRLNQDNNKIAGIVRGSVGSRYIWAYGQLPVNNWCQLIMRKVSGTSDPEVWHNGTLLGYASGDNPWGTFDITAFDQIRIGGLDQSVTYACTGKIAEVALWDESLSDTDVNSIIALDDMSTVNPTALVSHWPLYNSVTDYAGTNDLSALTGSVTYDINDHPLSAPDAGPLFLDPSPLTYKVSDTLTDVDMAGWFSDVSGTLSVVTDVLPAGIAATGNLLNGTFTTAQDVDTTATGTDDDGATDGVASWYISSYSLEFSGMHKLETPAGSPYSGTVNFSAFKGTIDGGFTGSALHFDARVVTGGIVSLTSASLTPETWTVLAQDDNDSTVVGIFEMTPE